MKKFEFRGKQWHEECFGCSVCRQPIGNKRFIPRDNEFVCVPCYEEQFAQRCAKCNGVSNSVFKLLQVQAITAANNLSNILVISYFPLYLAPYSFVRSSTRVELPTRAYLSIVIVSCVQTARRYWPAKNSRLARISHSVLIALGNFSPRNVVDARNPSRVCSQVYKIVTNIKGQRD